MEAALGSFPSKRNVWSRWGGLSICLQGESSCPGLACSRARPSRGWAALACMPMCMAPVAEPASQASPALCPLPPLLPAAAAAAACCFRHLLLTLSRRRRL